MKDSLKSWDPLEGSSKREEKLNNDLDLATWALTPVGHSLTPVGAPHDPTCHHLHRHMSKSSQLSLFYKIG